MSQRVKELPRRDREPATGAEAHVAHFEEEPAPVGTLFLMMLFLAAIVGLWGTIYWMLLTR
jgi:hypothetical protein